MPPQGPPPWGYPPVAGAPGYGYGYGPAPAQRSRGVVIAVVIAGVLVLICGLCTAGLLIAGHLDSSADGGAATPATSANPVVPGLPSSLPTGRLSPSTHTIVYEVSGGSGTADIIYSDADGAKETKKVDLPWRTEMARTGVIFAAMVSGIGTDSNPLTCRILVDGHEAMKRTSAGFVTCTHIVSG